MQIFVTLFIPPTHLAIRLIFYIFPYTSPVVYNTYQSRNKFTVIQSLLHRTYFKYYASGWYYEIRTAERFYSQEASDEHR